jgi:hypothetical protein
MSRRTRVEKLMRNIRETSLAQWMLNRACALHLKDPGRFDHGPAGSSFWGWFYFRVLCNIST